jgi:hypothetical protein
MFTASVPLMTQEVALQLEQAKADYIASWLQGMQESTEKSSEIAILRIGKLRAFAARHLQEIGLFNRVIGFGPHNQELLQEIKRFYHDHGVEKYSIEINPYNVSSEFLTSLVANRFSPSRFETYLYGIAAMASSHTSTTISVREITSSEIDLFASLHVEGYQEALDHVPEAQRGLYYESLKVLYERVGWHLCFVCINNLPIGMGMLYTQDGMATGAGAAIIPKYRQQGGQTTLIRYLLHEAVRAESTLVAAQTSVGSTSQHNVERLGMRTAYTGSSWICSDLP